MTKDFVREWKGNFVSSPSLSSDREFFGLPSMPPYYVGVDGMQNIVQNILNDVNRNLQQSSMNTSLRVFTGTRVAKLERDSDRWKLCGTSGIAAYHDTAEKAVQSNNETQYLGEQSGYDDHTAASTATAG